MSIKDDDNPTVLMRNTMFGDEKYFQVPVNGLQAFVFE